jgi:hypothetical protein
MKHPRKGKRREKERRKEKTHHESTPVKYGEAFHGTFNRGPCF